MLYAYKRTVKADTMFLMMLMTNGDDEMIIVHLDLISSIFIWFSSTNPIKRVL